MALVRRQGLEGEATTTQHHARCTHRPMFCSWNTAAEMVRVPIRLRAGDRAVRPSFEMVPNGQNTCGFPCTTSKWKADHIRWCPQPKAMKTGLENNWIRCRHIPKNLAAISSRSVFAAAFGPKPNNLPNAMHLLAWIQGSACCYNSFSLSLITLDLSIWISIFLYIYTHIYAVYVDVMGGCENSFFQERRTLENSRWCRILTKMNGGLE